MFSFFSYFKKKFRLKTKLFSRDWEFKPCDFLWCTTYHVTIVIAMMDNSWTDQNLTNQWVWNWFQENLTSWFLNLHYCSDLKWWILLSDSSIADKTCPPWPMCFAAHQQQHAVSKLVIYKQMQIKHRYTHAANWI